MPLKELFPESVEQEAKHGAAFAPMLATSPALAHALQRVGTVAQLTLLEPVRSGGEERAVCVANTHLFFHYAAPHIRTMHVWAILQEAQEFIDAWVADQSGSQGATTPTSTPSSSAVGVEGATPHRQRPAFVFCGDFNSDLNDGIPGAIQLLQAGTVSELHWDWAFGVGFSWDKAEEAGDGEAAAGGGKEGECDGEGDGMDDVEEVSKMVHTEVEGRRPGSPRSPAEVVPGVALASPFELASADGLRTEFTNYVKGYQGLLDYVW